LSSEFHEHHRLSNLLDVLRHRASHNGSELKFIGASGALEASWSRHELLRRSFGVAHALAHLPTGSRVAIVHPPGLPYVSAFFGAIAAGMVPVPVYPPERAALDRTLPRLEAIAANAGVRALLTARSTEDSFERIEHKSPLLAALPRIVTCELPGADDDGRLGPAPSDVAFLQYTSGSTQTPRGVRVTHASLLHNSRMIESVYDTHPEMTGVSWLPPYHDLGLIGGMVQPIYAGFDMVMMSPLTFLRRPLRWLQTISDTRARITAAPNFGYAWCLRHVPDEAVAQLDLSCLEFVLCGAEPIQPEVLRAFATKFAPAGLRPEALNPCYGLAEATLLVSASRRGTGMTTLRVDAAALSQDRVEPRASGGRELVSCGSVAPELDVRIVHPESGHEVSGVGEIVVDGASVAHGYHETPSETARTFTLRGLRTGDLGFVHDGELYVVGRRKELMIVRGRNFYPHDLEREIKARLPELADSTVIAGTFDAEGTALPVVVVEALGREQPETLTQLVYEVQAVIRESFLIAVEAAVLAKGSAYRTSSGKLERRRTLAALREGTLVVHAASPELEAQLARRADDSEQDESDAGAASPILSELVNSLATLLRLRPRDVDVDRPLPELGLDSVAAAELQARVYEQHRIELDMACMVRTTLRALAERIERDPAASDDHARVHASGIVEIAKPARGALATHDVLARPSLFFFASTEVVGGSRGPMYASLERAVRFADTAGFEAVWLPERHFHGFGAPFPNPAVLAAALAVQTSNIQLRAGSVVMPLNHPLRVVEEWGMVDRLSAGRVALSFTSGWNPRDFVLSPNDYGRRREKTLEGIETVRKLWRGEPQPFVDGRGETVEVESFPGPIQRDLSIWLTCTEGRERFAEAGRRGFNVLTALLFQDISTLGEHIEAYRQARAEAGHDRGHVTVAVHTYVAESDAQARDTARAPLRAYLQSSVGLWQQRSAALATMSESEKARALEYATERYMTGSLVGSQEACAERVRTLSRLGADELACLTDFGVGAERAYTGLQQLAELWEC
jgi:natural product biosynthesis luciferase-like monooxygenase protein